VLSSQNTPISQINGEIFISPSQSEKNVYKNSIQISLDSATIKGQLRARSRQVGDRILQGGMHKSLKKLFCERFGVSPKRYIIQMQINHACELLRLDRYSVTHISDMSGFSDAGFFCRQFKKYMGITPGGYKSKFH
jgi:methylphosphotriester-DNA--protein-cysteine methyltransferase